MRGASACLVEVLGSALLSATGRPFRPELARCNLCLARENGADVLLTLSFTLSYVSSCTASQCSAQTSNNAAGMCSLHGV